MSSALQQAREVLNRGGDLVALAEAIGTVISDPSSSLDDVRLGLRYGGIIAEQAALELRRRQAAVSAPAQSEAVVLPGDDTRGKPPTKVR
jgi:hypothetical protein